MAAAGGRAVARLTPRSNIGRWPFGWIGTDGMRSVAAVSGSVAAAIIVSL